MDNGKTVHADPQFHELMRKAALHMHIKEHELTDGSGSTGRCVCGVMEQTRMMVMKRRSNINELTCGNRFQRNWLVPSMPKASLAPTDEDISSIWAGPPHSILIGVMRPSTLPSSSNPNPYPPPSLVNAAVVINNPIAR
jgi:hypothetical protein